MGQDKESKNVVHPIDGWFLFSFLNVVHKTLMSRILGSRHAMSIQERAERSGESWNDKNHVEGGDRDVFIVECCFLRIPVSLFSLGQR